MRALVQRVSEASVTVEDRVTGAIGAGLLVLVGITDGDGAEDRDWLVRKIVQLRVFDDDAGVMNRSVVDVGGEVLAVSQFTLYADSQKGLRPSYISAAPPDIAKPLYDQMLQHLQQTSGLQVEAGIFAAMMDVELVNDGPVTIWLEREAESS